MGDGSFEGYETQKVEVEPLSRTSGLYVVHPAIVLYKSVLSKLSTSPTS